MKIAARILLALAALLIVAALLLPKRVHDVDLGRGMAAGLLGVVLRVMLGHSEETALHQLERSAQAR